MFDIWRTHQLVGLIVLTVMLIFIVFHSFGFRFALALVYTLISAVMLFQNPNATWGELQTRIDATSAISFGTTLLMVFVLTASQLKTLYVMLENLFLIALINCVLVLIHGYGIFNASSMDCTFIALMMPYGWIKRNALFNRKQTLGVWTEFIFVYGLPVATIIKAQGSTPYFILFGALAAWTIVYKSKIFSVLLAVPLAIGFITQKEQFLDNNGRFEVWRLFMSWFWDNANVLLGTGTGSFQWLGPAIQGTNKNLFLFMHNEYLQAIFEQGIVGFVLFSMVAISMLLKARKSPWLFCSLVSVLISMLTQFPFRYFVSQFLILVLLRITNEEFRNGPNGK